MQDKKVFIVFPRIMEQFRLEGTSGSLCSSSLLMNGHPEQFAQNQVPMAFEDFQGENTTNSLGSFCDSGDLVGFGTKILVRIQTERWQELSHYRNVPASHVHCQTAFLFSVFF